MCDTVRAHGARLANECHLSQSSYASPHPWITVLFDDTHAESWRACVSECRREPLQHVVVLGIGGSSLPTKALYDLLRERTAAQLWILDGLDYSYTMSVWQQLSDARARGEHICACVVSKSGTTVETRVHMDELAYYMQQWYGNECHKRCIAITQKCSLLDAYASQHSWKVIEYPAEVSGRFGIWSAATLLPLALCGLDANRLLKAARHACREWCHAMPPHGVEVCASWGVAYAHGCRVWSLWYTHAEQYACMEWYKQLLGESLGKISQKGSPEGVVPLCARITHDLHTILQTHCAGPRCIYTTLYRYTPAVSDERYEALTNAATGAVYTMLNDAQRPVLLCNQLPDYESLAYDMIQGMMQVVCMAGMLSIEPYTQPDIELYKHAMRQVYT